MADVNHADCCARYGEPHSPVSGATFERSLPACECLRAG